MQSCRIFLVNVPLLFYQYSRRSLIRSHLDAQILDTDYFLRLIELTVIYSKNAKSILKIRIKKNSRVTDW